MERSIRSTYTMYMLFPPTFLCVARLFFLGMNPLPRLFRSEEIPAELIDKDYFFDELSPADRPHFFTTAPQKEKRCSKPILYPFVFLPPVVGILQRGFPTAPPPLRTGFAAGEKEKEEGKRLQLWIFPHLPPRRRFHTFWEQKYGPYTHGSTHGPSELKL